MLSAGFLITGIFQTSFAPASHTFINGLTSTDKATSLERLSATLVYLGKEFISPKWNGFWIILGAACCLCANRIIRKINWLVPAIFITYLLAVIGVYWINTFFEIIWWLSTTLNRLLYALTPGLVFWLFCAADTKSK